MINLPIVKPPDDCPCCWKGVPREEFRYGKTVSWELFCPHPNDIVIEGWLGTSVNWDLNSDEGAVRQLLTRKKDGEIQFRAGAVRIPRAEIDRIIDQYAANEELTYELRKELNNNYHGNLLFNVTLHKDTNKKRSICGALTKVVDDSRRQEQSNA